MTPLHRKAFARLPLPEADVESLYAVWDIAAYPRGSAIDAVRLLCESHERLRLELDGAGVLLADADARMNSEADNLQHKVDLAKDAGDEAARCLDATRAEVRAVLAQLDELASVWGDEGVFRRCRDRLRAVITDGRMNTRSGATT